MLDQFLLSRLHSVFENNEGRHLFAVKLIGNTDGGSGGHRRVLIENFINFARIDVLASANDHVGLAIDDVKEALLVTIANVAGVKPATPKRTFGRFGIFEIAFENVFASQD